MGKFVKTALPLATAVSAALCAQAASAFEYHGYFRAGVGANGEGGDQVCFQAPGAGSKYRLGNECETYTEQIFADTLFEGENGAYFNVKTNLAFVVQGEQDFEQFSPALREMYSEAGNLFGGVFAGSKVWAGKRFYRRHDVHITDFFYWDNTSPGAGIEDFDLGFGKLAFAWLRNATDSNEELSVPIDTNGDGVDDARENIEGNIIPINNRATSDLDLRVYGIDANPGAQVEFGITGRLSDESQDDFSGRDGVWLNAVHFQEDVFGGFNKLAFQYGWGAGSTLNSFTNDEASGSANTYRIVETLLVEPDPDWSMMFTAVWEKRVNQFGEGETQDQTWWSVGARPKYYFTDYINVALEAGFDSVDRDSDPNGARNLFKLTLAPQISAGRGFFARPALRAFITYANWNDSAAQAGVIADGGENPFSGTDGITYGVQAEAWW